MSVDMVGIEGAVWSLQRVVLNGGGKLISKWGVIVQVYQQIQEDCEGGRYMSSKRTYRPHITLARIAQITPSQR
jgi:2'-5' RNA ligase